MISIDQMVEQLLDLGIVPGGVLLVHTAFSRVKPVEEGPHGLIRALRSALGQDGTLVMPSMSYDDDRPFDSKTTPCLEMGITADTFWRLPGILRSDSPHAFAAVGPNADPILAPHPIDLPHGLNSPVGRVYELNGQVLLIGVGHTANTTVHLAEYLAGVRYRRQKSVTTRVNGELIQYHYREIDHYCQRFHLVATWLDDQHQQARGTVGHAEAILARPQAVVASIVEHLQTDETIFLHPPGVDEECDEARNSLVAGS